MDVNNDQILVFSNGIFLKKNRDGYSLIAGKTNSNIDFELTLNNLELLEKNYRIKLLGFLDTNNNTERIILIDNGKFFDGQKFTVELTDKGFKIREYVINKIFGNKLSFDKAFNSIPLEIEFAGIDTKHFFSRENLNNIFKEQSSTINNKFFTYFNIQSVIDDTISQLIACEKRIINIGIEQFNWLQSIKGTFEKSKEFVEFGLYSYYSYPQI